MREIRNAFRALRGTPVVSAVAVLSLALGIGANTAMFSILDSLLLRALPVKAPERLAIIGQLPAGRQSWTNPIWEAIRDRPELFEGTFAYSSLRFNLASGGQSEMVDGVWTTARYFEVLGVKPVLGRTWVTADDRRGGGPDGPVAVIGYNFWQRRFDGAADAIGRTLTVERVPFTIVGVTPPGFFGTEVGRTFDVAIPIGTEPLIRGKESALDRRSSWWLTVMARLRPDQSIDDGIRALRGVQPQIREATLPQDIREENKKNYLTQPWTLVPAATGASFMRARYQRPLTTLMVVVGLVLLIACANIANLLLARASARRHELSVRLALGASPFRLARQLLTESLVLSGVGAILGLLFARWFSHVLVRQLSSSTNFVFLELSLDWRILAFTAAVAIATTVLFGTAPALRAARVRPNDAIKEQGRSVGAQGRLTVGNVLVVVQVALSLMLVVGAGLFVRTFSSLATLNPGFEAERILIVNVNAQPLQLETPARVDLFARLRDAALSTPGVQAAAVSVTTPISGSTWAYALDLLDGKRVDASDRSFHVNIVSPDFFKTYGTRLIAGRDLTDGDKAGAPVVAVVNEAFAKKFTGGANPVGRRFREPDRPGTPNPEREIVGYVADAAYRTLREPVPPTIYIPIAQEPTPPSSVSISVRASAGSPALLTKALAASLINANSSVSITFRQLTEQVDASLTQERIVAMLSGFFGGLALLLAALGLYGVTSYAVSRRRTEIGIRMALGAAPAGVIAMVLGRVALLVTLGVVAGGAASLWASQYVAALLYGLQPRDPLTFVGATAVLGAIGALAGWLPARRASRIDPARVLREG